MTPDEIKTVVKDVLAEQRIANKADLDDAATKTVAAVLKSFGIEDDDRKEVQADFLHLRKWRKSVEQAQSYTFKAVITVIAGGVLGALWLGFKTMLGK
jgi:single-stranded DNA-binding protein